MQKQLLIIDADSCMRKQAWSMIVVYALFGSALECCATGLIEHRARMYSTLPTHYVLGINSVLLPSWLLINMFIHNANKTQYVYT